MSNLEETWRSLDEAARAFLLALFQQDQIQEQRAYRLRAASWDTVPAHEWRWVACPLEPRAASSPLVTELRRLGMEGESLVSALRALAACQLLLIRRRLVDDRQPPLVEVQITRLGRRLVRLVRAEALGETGLLQEWHWRALAELYHAWLKGTRVDRYKSRTGWETWRRLMRFEQGSLVREHDGFLELTEFGCSYYEQNHARYLEFFPAVDAAQPRA